jgi:histidine ammonia-lyase
MGTIAARKAVKILENTENVLAIEILTACQAIDFRDPRKLGKKTKAIYQSIRKISKFVSEDKELSPEIIKIKSLLCD